MRQIRHSILYSLIIITAFALHSGHIYSEEKFDPKSVQPVNYKPDNYNLGYVPMTQAEKDFVDEDDTPMVESTSRKLPRSFDLSNYMPPVGNQGRQGSCVGWASTYGIKSYHEKMKNKWAYGKQVQTSGGTGEHVFSPAWTYNQINRGRDRGSSPWSAAMLLRDKGAVSWKTMPYSDKNYLRQPTAAMKQLALKYRIQTFRVLNKSNPVTIKQEIASGNPVLGGVKVYTNFYSLKKKVYDHASGTLRGGHAIVIVGYDDDKRSDRGDKGAFKIFNSWGKWWGDKGYGWVSYRAMAGSTIGLGAIAIRDSDADISDKSDEKKKPVDVDVDRVRAPENITASKGTFSDKIVLSWNKVSGAIAYRIKRSVGDSNSFEFLAYVRTNTYSDRAIQEDINFKYRIITVTLKGKSTASDSPVAEGYALTRKSNIPAKVIGLKATASNNRVVLTWQKVEAATSYYVIRYSVSQRKWVQLGSGSKVYYRDNSPSSRYTNYYRVCAANKSGYGKWSSLVSININQRTGPPQRVAGINASRGTYSDRIVVRWTGLASAKYYGIYRWNVAARKWDKYVTSTRNSFIDRTNRIRDGRTYLYTVKAFNRFGSSRRWSSYARGYTKSDEISVSSGLSINPPKSVRGQIDHEKGTIDISWNKVPAASGYAVYRKESGDTDFKRIKNLETGTTLYSEKIPGKFDDICFYIVRSIDNTGTESNDSEIIAGYINTETPLVMTEFNPEEGIKNFKGTWRAVYWEYGKKPYSITLSIDGTGDMFSVNMGYAENKNKIFTGYYAYKSRDLQNNDFSFELLEAFDNDVAKVEFKKGVVAQTRVVLHFSRDLNK